MGGGGGESEVNDTETWREEGRGKVAMKHNTQS